MLPTADQLQAAVGCPRGLALTWERPIREACSLYDIATPARLSAFLAQVGHESAGLSRTVENLNYSAQGLLATWPGRFNADAARVMQRNQRVIANHVYGGRLGNSAPDDGWRYRGRGLIQVTGKANYDGVADLLRQKVPNVPDLVMQPDALAEPRWAALSAGAYWHDRGLNELADVGDMRTITKRINGGLNGLEDRMKRYERARAALA